MNLRFSRHFYFPYSRIFTKDHRVKKFDVTNRTKALDDCISTIIGIDDRYIFESYSEKHIANTAEAYVNVTIEAIGGYKKIG